MTILRRILCLTLLLGAALPALSQTDARELIDAGASFPDRVQAPGRGEMRYYPQNDPAWGLMTYRFPHQTMEPRFSGTGCIPSALANCIANLVPEERLPLLGAFSYQSQGFSICPCSMNRFDCDQTHDRYLLTTPEEYGRYFCLVIGSYLSGNNPQADYACGTLYLARELFRQYGLDSEETESLSQAAQAVRRDGALAVMMVGGPDCPFTEGGHALVLCDVDGDNYYFLDSFRREAYPLDTRRILRVVEPGLVAVRRDRAADLGAYQIHVVYPPSAATDAGE